jgi:penicillin-binding protein 2
MATMISAVFNGGVVHRPQLTKRIGKTRADKVHRSSLKARVRLGIRQGHLELVRKALIGVVNEPRGTGSKARVKDITVAGKTGTAQVVALKKGKGPYDQKEVPFKFRDHAWFVAVAPAEKPKIAIVILIEHGGHGGSTAAPIAKEIIGAYLGAPE